MSSNTYYLDIKCGCMFSEIYNKACISMSLTLVSETWLVWLLPPTRFLLFIMHPKKLNPCHICVLQVCKVLWDDVGKQHTVCDMVVVCVCQVSLYPHTEEDSEGFSLELSRAFVNGLVSCRKWKVLSENPWVNEQF